MQVGAPHSHSHACRWGRRTWLLELLGDGGGSTSGLQQRQRSWCQPVITITIVIVMIGISDIVNRHDCHSGFC